MESIFDWLEPTEAGLFDISDGTDRLRDVLRIHRAANVLTSTVVWPP